MGRLTLPAAEADQVRDHPHKAQQSADRSQRHGQRRADKPGAFARQLERVGRRPFRRAAKSFAPAQVCSARFGDYLVRGHAFTSTAASAVRFARIRDDESYNNLRDVVRGFLALAKIGSGAKPELQAMMQSLELSGTGKTVSSFVAGRVVR
jgi:hypothetical protein